MNVVFMLLTTVSAGDPGLAIAPPGPGCAGGHCGAVADCCEPACCCEVKCKKQKCKKAKECDCCPVSCDCGAVSSCCEPTCCCEVKCKKQKCKKSKKKDCCCQPSCCDGCGHGGYGGYDGHAVPGPIHGAPMHGAPMHGAPIHGAPGIVPSAPALPAAPGGSYTPGTILNPGSPLPGTTITPSAPIPGKTAEPIKTQPKEKTGAFAPFAPVQPTAVQIETESKNPFELARRYEMRVARAADYSKLTGQLFFVHADGGTWVLRYAPLSEEDANGGSVVLTRDGQMNSYREGDLVAVEGKVISEKGSARLGGALYQVRSISLVDRPAQ